MRDPAKTGSQHWVDPIEVEDAGTRAGVKRASGRFRDLMNAIAQESRTNPSSVAKATLDQFDMETNEELCRPCEARSSCILRSLSSWWS